MKTIQQVRKDMENERKAKPVTIQGDMLRKALERRLRAFNRQ